MITNVLFDGTFDLRKPLADLHIIYKIYYRYITVEILYKYIFIRYFYCIYIV